MASFTGTQSNLQSASAWSSAQRPCGIVTLDAKAARPCVPPSTFHHLRSITPMSHIRSSADCLQRGGPS
eukprot:4321543-Pyramimonas_sp.AAC.1